MKKLFGYRHIDLIKFVVGKISSYLGCPGIGKTIAIQKIIRD
jgi:F0F1-type ATP synthase beta subunit